MLKHANKTSFKKGQTPWNKGKSNYWLIGVPRTKAVRDKIRKAHSGMKKPWVGKNRNPNVKIKCLTCGKEFEVVYSRKDKAKFCSNKCRGSLLKGRIPKNKGNFTSKTYGGCHSKVRKIRGTPSQCEECGTESAKKFEWANLTGHYENEWDYKRLCTSCHNKLDNKIRNITDNRRKKSLKK
jgi:hypothetical protein